jgi:hypothetical protein
MLGWINRSGLMDKQRQRLRTYTAFEEAAREAFAAGNTFTELEFLLEQQNEEIEKAKDLLWVKDI